MHLFNWTTYLSTKPAPVSSLFVEFILTLSIDPTATVCFFLFLLLLLLPYTVAPTAPTRSSKRTVQAGKSIARSKVVRVSVPVGCESSVVWCEGDVYGCEVSGKEQ